MILFILINRCLCNHILHETMNHSKQILAGTIDKIEGAYSCSTIRAYKADFAQFIEFCEDCNEGVLPAKPLSVVHFIT